MSEDNNISAMGQGRGLRGPLPEAQLMAYLEGRLTAEEQHEVELWLADEGMESDALDGLAMLKPEETKQSVQRLNHRLRHTLAKKKRRRRPAGGGQMAVVAIAVVLLLAVLAYIVIRACF